MACEYCNGSGWMPVRIEGGTNYSGVQRCVCRTRAKAEAEKERPGGFTAIGDLRLGDQANGEARDVGDWSKEKPMERQQPTEEEIERGDGIRYAAARAAMLQMPDREIAAIILNHRGKQNAVSIDDICKTLWASAWYGGGSEDAAELHRKRNQLARTVKASVERIRAEARIPVAACKGNPGGYYIPVTAEECDEMHDRHMREGIKHILTARLFKPEADLVQELRGQLELQEVGSRK